jgi:putative addiction module component (TIGR02574 family)
MKRVDLPLSQLTFSEKLDLLELIWADLSREEEKLESPAWHKAVLEDREAASAAGKVSVSDWGEAKERIRKNVS